MGLWIVLTTGQHIALHFIFFFPAEFISGPRVGNVHEGIL